MKLKANVHKCIMYCMSLLFCQLNMIVSLRFLSVCFCGCMSVSLSSASVFLSLSLYLSLCLCGPKGGWALLMSPPYLQSQGRHLIPSFYPSPVAHSVFSLFLLLARSPAYFPEVSLNLFSRDRLFCIALMFRCFSGWKMISRLVVSVACYLMALVLVTLCG